MKLNFACSYIFCINERTRKCSVPYLPKHAVAHHTLQYEEFLNELDVEAQYLQAGGYILSP
jgi:hypothetical protein